LAKVFAVVVVILLLFILAIMGVDPPQNLARNITKDVYVYSYSLSIEDYVIHTWSRP